MKHPSEIDKAEFVVFGNKIHQMTALFGTVESLVNNMYSIMYPNVLQD